MSADGQQEPSMEDILASIRKILSEDDGDAAKPAEPPKPAPAPVKAAEPPPPPPPAPEPEPEPEPEPVFVPEPEPEPEPVFAVEPEEESMASIFEEPPEEPGPDIMAVDPEPEPLELSMEQQVPQEPVYQQQPMYPQQPQYQPQQYQEYPQQYLVGDPAAQAAGASIAGLAQAVARERAIALGNSGITLEQLVREICTPVLKHWLDTNLPYMVERIVKQEIERIVNRSETM